MRTHAGLLRLALLSAALLGSLSLVVWRQSRALELLRDLDRTRMSRAIAEAQRSDVSRRVEYLEGRARVVAEAKSRLGLRVPSADEIVILPLGSTPVSRALATGNSRARERTAP
jgi:cell division protein FtsL